MERKKVSVEKLKRGMAIRTAVGTAIVKRTSARSCRVTVHTTLGFITRAAGSLVSLAGKAPTVRFKGAR